MHIGCAFYVYFSGLLEIRDMKRYGGYLCLGHSLICNGGKWSMAFQVFTICAYLGAELLSMAHSTTKDYADVRGLSCHLGPVSES